VNPADHIFMRILNDQALPHPGPDPSRPGLHLARGWPWSRGLRLARHAHTRRRSKNLAHLEVSYPKAF